MTINRREFIKTQAIAAAAASAGIALPAVAQQKASPTAAVRWDKGVCRFCGTGCAVLVGVWLDRTPWGVGVRMTGSNANATAYSGVDVRRVLMKVYILSGLLCGVAALIMIARFNSARAGYGSSYLLVTVLASVLGGVNPDGGFGKVGGLVVALMVLQVIGSGLNLLGLSPHLAIALWGGILLFVIALRLLRARRAGQ